MASPPPRSLIALASGGLAIAGLFFAVDAVQVVVAQALRARGDVLAPTITHIISYAFLMLPLGWALAVPLGLGLNGAVWAVIVASIASAGLLAGRFLWLARRDV
jgi:multidrug resistance protein, MATE family